MRLDAIGWVATAVFPASYLFRSGAALRRVQALAALLWIAYGVAIASKPVVAANAIVAIAALGSAVGAKRFGREDYRTVRNTPPGDV
jgi:hypothetical protein